MKQRFAQPARGLPLDRRTRRFLIYCSKSGNELKEDPSRRRSRPAAGGPMGGAGSRTLRIEGAGSLDPRMHQQIRPPKCFRVPPRYEIQSSRRPGRSGASILSLGLQCGRTRWQRLPPCKVLRTRQILRTRFRCDVDKPNNGTHQCPLARHGRRWPTGRKSRRRLSSSCEPTRYYFLTITALRSGE